MAMCTEKKLTLVWPEKILNWIPTQRRKSSRGRSLKNAEDVVQKKQSSRYKQVYVAVVKCLL